MSSPPPRNPYTVARSEDDWLYAIYLRSEQKPMEAISQLYYRMHVYWQHRFGGLSDQQAHEEAELPLTLSHVLTVLKYLFEEQVPEGTEINHTDAEPSEPDVAFFPRLYAVNAQAVRAFRTHLRHLQDQENAQKTARSKRHESWLHRILHFFFPPKPMPYPTQYPTRHRPYDMLAAIFLCASKMPATPEQKGQLRAYRDKFAHMYLNAGQNFDYQDKDVYTHDSYNIKAS